MRIVSCYIENFGGLHHFSYDFKDGLNIVYEKNGWGKSTLAAFMKAMFYGLETTTKRSLDENEKKKYEPWNGGAYGGNLTFETDGRVYRVERFFGGKDKEDRFVLYDVVTGLESDAYTGNLGEELFGIDRVAFEQSVFMKQGVYAVSMTDSVAAKMSGLMASGDDVDRYEKACERLDNEMKVYKKTGNKGKIAEVTEEIAILKRHIEETKQVEAALHEWKNKAEECSLEIEEGKTRKENLKVQMRKAGKQAALREKSKHYHALLEEKMKLETRVEELDRFFRNGMPEEEELEQYRNKMFAYKNTESKVTEQCEQDFKYPDLVSVLSRNPMTEAELDACEQKWNSLCEKEELLEKKEIQLKELQLKEEEKKLYQRQKTKEIRNIRIVLAVIFVVFCVFVYFAMGWMYALIAVGVALVLAAVAMILWVKSKKKLTHQDNENEELLQLQGECEELGRNIESGKNAVRMYLQAFEVCEDREMQGMMNRLRITLMEINAGEARKRELMQAEEKREEEKRLLRQELILFFRKFYPETSDVEEYLLKEITQKRNDYRNVSGQYEEKCKQLEQAEPVEEVAEEQLLSMEALQQQEAVLEREILAKEEHFRQIKTTISEYTEMVEEGEKREAEKQELEELLAEYQAKYKLLEKTLKYLKTAQAEFSSRYLKKINEGYRKYAKLLNDARLNHSEVDLKLAVKTDESGARRDMAYFSKGTREAMELCTRFALVDALFDKEKPFVVLDDPFVNLDQDTLEGAMEILKCISTQYQLIYFTCHSSRK